MLTPQQKRERLAGIESEVPGFHNWLGVLFPRMPEVLYSEYTHGSAEMGADFVLEMRVPTTGRTVFVGVVAKKGSIKQDTADVDRQIEECGVRRKIKGGKQEVRLSQVWVISNETISRNAKDKIHDKYERLSVEFFAAGDLIEWTDNFACYLWENLPSDISHYLNAVRIGIKAQEREASLLGEETPEPYIELDVTAVDNDGYSGGRRKNKLISLHEEVKQRKIVLVEGGMGAGKSKLLRRLGLDLANEDAFNDTKLLPVLVQMRELFIDHGGSIETLLNRRLTDLAAQVKDGACHALVMIDGVDEFIKIDAAEPSPLAGLMAQVRQLPNVKVLLASRPGAATDLKLGSTADTRSLEIQPLSIKRISNFVHEACKQKNIQNRLVQDINRSDLFRQLPQNPIAALLLTRLVLESKSRDELPQTLTELFTQSLELMLGRWDMRKGSGLVTQQEYDVSRRVCGLVARVMIENNMSVIAIRQVESTLDEYLKERNLVIDRDQTLNRLFSRSGILNRDEKNGVTSFRHRSFAEYFCADEWHYTDQFDVDTRVLQRYWSDVYFFGIGMRPDCEQVLKDILACQPVTEAERWGKCFAPANYLLAGHLTPYRVVEENLYRLMLEAARLFSDIASGRVVSDAASLPEVSLLFVLQAIIRDYYGYGFFRAAIDDTAIKIVDSLESAEIRSYALFFIGVIGIELGYEDAMNFLVDTFKVGEIPLTLMLAVSGEADQIDSKKIPARLRAYSRQISKILKSNPGGTEALVRLTKSSISSRLASQAKPKRKSRVKSA